MDEKTESFFKKLNYTLFERGYNGDYKLPTFPVLASSAAIIVSSGITAYFMNLLASSGEMELASASITIGGFATAVGALLSYIAADRVIYEQSNTALQIR